MPSSPERRAARARSLRIDAVFVGFILLALWFRPVLVTNLEIDATHEIGDDTAYDQPALWLCNAIIVGSAIGLVAHRTLRRLWSEVQRDREAERLHSRDPDGW
jgi:hypothetical protein